MNITATVLGSGTSSGVPVIGCECKICTSNHPKNRRLRSSCWVQADGKSLLIDTGPDLREQALQNKINRVDAILYTHIHADHIHGIDEMRLYNAYQKQAIPAYGEEETLRHLEKHFSYIFTPSTTYPSLIPRLVAKPVNGIFDCEGIPVTMIPCHHGDKYMSYNYRIGNVAWLTDISDIPESSLELLQDLEVLFIDGLRYDPHPTHLHLEKSLKYIDQIGSKMNYLIHLSHDYDHDEMNQNLPSHIQLAYDRLQVKI